MGRCSLSLVLHSRWEAKGQSTLGQVSISQSFLLDALKSTLIPFSSHLILQQQQAALVADAYHQKWNISCCHAAVCSGAVARTGCFGVHPWISPSWVPVPSWGVRRLPDLSTAHCVFGCTPKEGKIPPKIQLHVGKGWNSASCLAAGFLGSTKSGFGSSPESHGKQARKDFLLEICVLQIPFLHSTLHLCWKIRLSVSQN